MRKHHARGFTLVELLITVSIVGVLAALALPGLLSARLTSNEASSVAAMRVISSAEASYAATCGAGGYATDLADLVKAPVGSPNAFISPDLGFNGVQKNGYQMNLAKNGTSGTLDVVLPSCNAAAAPRATSFFASAVPTIPGSTGNRYFATDTPGTIFMDTAAIANPIPVGTATFQ